jgi:hypothetical protein
LYQISSRRDTSRCVAVLSSTTYEYKYTILVLRQEKTGVCNTPAVLIMYILTKFQLDI